MLPLLAFALFILAVWLSEGRRREALRTTGWCFVGIGVFVLLARRLAGNDVVNALVKNPANKPAAHDAWTIATTLLYDIGVAVIVYGLVFVVAAWLAGHTRPATALRHCARPDPAHTSCCRVRRCVPRAAARRLLGPDAGHSPAPLHIRFIVLLALGIDALRRQTAREFPDAQAGDTERSIRALYGPRRNRTSGDRRVPAGDNGERVAEFERLATLHDHGVPDGRGVRGRKGSDAARPE